MNGKNTVARITSEGRIDGMANGHGSSGGSGQLLRLGLMLGLAAAILAGCGGANTTTSQPANTGAGSSSLTVFGGDAPLCDVVSFTVMITNATLTPEGGGAPVTVISSTNPVSVDFAALMDFFTVLDLASVPPGNYSSITLTLATPQLTVLQLTNGTPTPTAITTNLMTSTVTVNIDPELEVATTGSAGLELDFRLRRSVQTDSMGQVTGTVNPNFQASARSATPEGLGEDGDLKGLVQSVTTMSSNVSFIGSFMVVTEEGQSVTVQVNTNTQFDDISGLAALATNTFVEVEAFVDSNGNIVAKEVEAEGEDDEEQRRSAFIGMITAVTPATGGSVTQFSMFVRGEEPDQSACVPPKTSLTVNVTSDTSFRIAAKRANLAGLTFDATALTPGQNVVVHGQCQAGTPPSVNAASIFLRKQTILGNFATLLAAGSDGKTGGFTLTPCGMVFGGQPVTVFTFGQTDFVSVADLNALTPSPLLAVRGLFLNEQNSVTVNTIAITAPKLVFEAIKVHQLQ